MGPLAPPARMTSPRSTFTAASGPAPEAGLKPDAAYTVTAEANVVTLDGMGQSEALMNAAVGKCDF